MPPKTTTTTVPKKRQLNTRPPVNVGRLTKDMNHNSKVDAYNQRMKQKALGLQKRSK